MSVDAAIVDSFLRSRRERPKWVNVPDEYRPRTEEEGYRFQRAVYDRLDRAGVKRVGYKVGSTSAAGQKALGLREPVYAGIFESSRAPALTSELLSGLIAPSVECEIALDLKAPLDGSDPKLSIADVAAAVETCRIACEVVDNRYGEPLAVGIPTLLVDDFFHASFVLGEPTLSWRRLDFSSLAAFIRVNDNLHAGNSADVLNALESVLWLARKLAGNALRLETGEIILTGSIVTPTRVVFPVERLEVAVAGVGALNWSSESEKR
jgi:2-keto-4-pentenoate hydratase